MLYFNGSSYNTMSFFFKKNKNTITLDYNYNLISKTDCVQKILSASHDLEQFPALKLELGMRQPLCLLGD